MCAAGELEVVRDVENRLALLVNRSSSSNISRAVPVSRLPVGSSPTISFGSDASERAIATRCCSPPESSDGR
jgi:hypothetical protein